MSRYLGVPHSSTLLRRVLARSFIDEINTRTVCKYCGKQPVEWHSDRHKSNPNLRIGNRVAQGYSIELIQEELEKCEPVCRACHMGMDGRLLALHLNNPWQPLLNRQPKPCMQCGRPFKPLVHGLCNRCYHKARRLRKGPRVCGPYRVQ